MKKYFLILLIGFLAIIPCVKAEENITYNIPLDYSVNSYQEFVCSSKDKIGSSSFDTAYNEILNYYLKNIDLNKYPNYVISVLDSSDLSYHFYLYAFKNSYSINVTDHNISFEFFHDDSIQIYFDSSINDYSLLSNYDTGFSLWYGNNKGGYSYYTYVDSNFLITFDSANFVIRNFYDDDIILNSGDVLPKVKDLMKYNSFSDYSNNYDSIYTEVNLDNYEYVILLPKDQTKKDAYDVNLKVKGMIGITPVYEFGTVSKDSVLNNKVEDRCNVSYSDYTDYRFYILKSDIQNHAVYYVKSCESGSSFKFKNSDFVAYYVTEENKDDFVLTIGGLDYHIIPYEELPSTATKNEEENYVPGESERFALLDIIDNLTNTLDGIWKSFVTFMGFVTKMFSTLPIEFRTIAITTFTVSCVLGLIKILKG